jgi:hypothetical protein
MHRGELAIALSNHEAGLRKVAADPERIRTSPKELVDLRLEATFAQTRFSLTIYWVRARRLGAGRCRSASLVNAARKQPPQNLRSLLEIKRNMA